MQIYIYFDECLLKQIFGILGRCRTLQKEAAYSVAIAIEEVFKSYVVAPERELHQLFVVGDYVIDYFHAVLSLRSIAMRRHIIIRGLNKSKIKYFSATLFSPTRLAIERARRTTAM